MKSGTVSLLIGRVIAVLGSLLLLWSLTQPWVTLEMSSYTASVPDVRISLSGNEFSTLAASSAAVVALVADTADLLDEIITDPVSRRQVRDQIDGMEQVVTGLWAWLTIVWALPIVTAVLAIVLLLSGRTLRFRRGFGAALGLIALTSLVTLAVTGNRVDNALEVVRENPAMRDALEAAERLDIALDVRTESGLRTAPLFALMIVLGGLAELVLPLSEQLRARLRMPVTLNAPALQPAAAGAIRVPGTPAVSPAEIDRGDLGSDSGETRAMCPQCGKALVSGARFCGSCGMRQVS
jgi:hypothetical protein